VTEKLKAIGRKVLAVTADLTKEEQVYRAIKEVAEFFGRIDILVNNVGGGTPEMAQMVMEHLTKLPDARQLPPTAHVPASVWDKVYELNLKSHVMLSNAVTPYFVKQRSGKIVNVSSTSGRVGEADNSAYCAMKAGDISLTWSLARALAPFNVNVNCICPGLVYTPLWKGASAARRPILRARIQEMRRKGEKLQDWMEGWAADDAAGMSNKEMWLKYLVLAITPLGREQTPEDMGRAVAFLVSEEAKNITGQTLHIDGGYVMR
jgi:NAD(P)-dependent dehydrogenase (short-subunit alcohol dehydrogenase family)